MVFCSSQGVACFQGRLGFQSHDINHWHVEELASSLAKTWRAVACGRMFDLWHGIVLDTRLGHFSYQGSSSKNPRSDGQQLWQFCSQGDEKALIYQSIRIQPVLWVEWWSKTPSWFAFAGWHIPPLTKADLTTKMATFVATISFTTPVLSRNVE